MTHDRSESGLEELHGLLEAYGADRERWPQAARARTEGVLAAGGQAARMLAETKALDAVLAHAPLPAPERRAALADHILAEAHGMLAEGAGNRRSRQPGTVIPWPGAARRVSSPAAGTTTRPAPWRAAALLAASLALGVFIGALNLAPAPLSQLMEAVDFDSDFDQTAAALASDGLAAALDEDLL